jgi:phage shock protein B
MKAKTIGILAAGAVLVLWLLPQFFRTLASFGPESLAILLIFGLPMVAVIGGLFIVALKVLKSGSSGHPHPEGDDAQMIQELYQGMARMEQRIESLETIILEKHRSHQEEETFPR